MYEDSPLPLPKPRAGKAKDSLYRHNLSDEDVRILARVAKSKGVRDEANLLRLYLVRAHDAGEDDQVLKILPILARVEEAQSRIEMRRRGSDDDRVDEVLGAVYNRLMGAIQTASIAAANTNAVALTPVSPDQQPLLEDSAA
jgi:hypothetical protein